MIFRKSLAKPLFNDLKFSLRSNLAIPAVASAFLLLIIQNYTTLKHLMSLPEAEGYGSYRYYFFDLTYQFFILKIFLIAFGAIVGLVAFQFVNNKKMSNTFFSFNIKRSGLFVNRCISSLVHIFLALLVPMLFVLIVNNYFLGFEVVFLLPWFYSLIAMFVYAFLGFAIAALAAISAGSSIEALIYTLMFYFAPYMLLYGTEQLFNTYLQGYPVSNSSPFGVGYMPSIIKREVGIVNRLSFLNPMAYLDYKGSGYSWMIRGNFLAELTTGSEGAKINIGQGHYMPVLMWAIVAACMLAFAFLALNKRKAENAGSFGKSKIVRGFAVTLFSVFAFCLSSVFFAKGAILSIVISTLVFFAVYFILELLILRNLSELKDGLIKLPIVFGVLLLVLIVPLSGAFGYSKRIPKADDVKEVYISPLMNKGIYYTVNYSTSLGPFTSEADKAKALNLHKVLMEQNPALKSKKANVVGNDMAAGYYVQYRLKDGKNLNRYYPIYDEDLKAAIIDFADSEYIRNYIAEIFTGSMNIEEIEKLIADYYIGHNKVSFTLEEFEGIENLQHFFYSFDFYNMAFFIGKDGLSNGQELSMYLSGEDIKDLKKHLINDILRLGAEKVLYPKEKVVGTFIVASHEYSMFIGEEDKRHPDAMHMLDLAYSGNVLQITEDMTETLKFLKAKDMLKDIEDSKKIVSAGFIKGPQKNVEKFTEYYSWYFNDYLQGFFGVFMKGHKVNNLGLELVSDPAKLQKLYDSAYLNYGIEKEGYLVRFDYSDDSSSVLYIPESLFPL